MVIGLPEIDSKVSVSVEILNSSLISMSASNSSNDKSSNKSKSSDAKSRSISSEYSMLENKRKIEAISPIFNNLESFNIKLQTTLHYFCSKNFITHIRIILYTFQLKNAFVYEFFALCGYHLQSFCCPNTVYFFYIFCSK